MFTTRVLGAALAAACLCGLPDRAAAQTRYTFSPGGDEVTDTSTGLTWKRCIEGMTWSGSTCTGSPVALNHEQALAYARDKGAWRMPNIKELSTLVERNNAGPNPAAFPTALGSRPGVWSTTPFVPDSTQAWMVHFFYGGVSMLPRSQPNAVWLVKIGQSQQWDVVADFSLTANPNGPWQYRWDTPIQASQPMGTTATNCSSLIMSCWKVSAASIDLPFIAVNKTGAPITVRTVTAPNNTLVLHPGFTSPTGTNQRPVITWTAPEAGTYLLSGKFQIVDTIPSGIKLLVAQDTTVFINEILNGVGAVRQISVTRTMNAGQVLSFTLDANGSHGNDSTAFTMTITKQ